MGFKKTFNGNGETFSAFYEAEKWLRDNGYSFGSMCRGEPMGILKGRYCIPKWRNLSREDKAQLDGTLEAGREGPATLLLKQDPIIGVHLPELHLNLKGEYFHGIDDGSKSEEYRLVTPHWIKRLEGKQFSAVVVKLGYPKADDESRIRRRVWKGVTRKTITHPHFGPDPVEVFAIDVSEAI